MALYHFSGQIISRSKGQSAVASAAYRSGEKLYDERYGQTKFYKRDTQPIAFILKPNHAPDWCLNRERLWNEVEKHEKAKNSQLAREFNVALPVELPLDEQISLTKDYCQTAFVERGMVADVAIHLDDKHNPHFHVMLTTRPFDEQGKWGIKSRKIYLYDEEGNPLYTKSGYRANRKENVTDWDSKETMHAWRKGWADLTNMYLEKNGFSERISEKSYAELGVTKQPTIHEGYVARQMEKRGRMSDRVQINVLIKKENAAKELLQDVKEEIQLSEESDGIHRLLSPDEKKQIAALSKDLKLFINYDNVIEKKRILVNWLTNEQTQALFSEEPSRIETILAQDQKVEEAFALLTKESNRIVSRYYPSLQTNHLSQHALNRLAEVTIQRNQPLTQEEANRLLTEETQHELTHYLKIIAKRPLETYDEYNAKYERLQNQVDTFKKTHQLSHFSPDTLQALTPAQQGALKAIVKDLERTKLALTVINGYYEAKINRQFPTLDVAALTIQERVLYGDTIDYYGNRLTLNALENITTQPLFKYDDAAYELVARYVQEPKKRAEIQAILAEMYPTLAEELANPRMRTLVFNELMEKGIVADETLTAYVQSVQQEPAAEVFRPRKVSLLFQTLFRPEKLEQILNHLAYEEAQQIHETEREHKKALRKKKHNRMKGLRGNR